jgi:hypothetical protein
MSSPLKQVSKLTKNMHPVVTIGVLIAAAAATWYAAKAYQKYKESQPGAELE